MKRIQNSSFKPPLPLQETDQNPELKVLQNMLNALKVIYEQKTKAMKNISVLIVTAGRILGNTLGIQEQFTVLPDETMQLLIQQKRASSDHLIANTFRTHSYFVQEWQNANKMLVQVETRQSNEDPEIPDVLWLIRSVVCPFHFNAGSKLLAEAHKEIDVSPSWAMFVKLKKTFDNMHRDVSTSRIMTWDVTLITIQGRLRNDPFEIDQTIMGSITHAICFMNGRIEENEWVRLHRDVNMLPGYLFCYLYSQYRVLLRPTFSIAKTMKMVRLQFASE